jgi:NAD(P)-dependent dehydrogenase (short-subunit alcohol dehydrogenase family)
VSSMAGRTGLSGQVAYAASKGGLQSAMKTVAIENAGLGITANCVLPGLVSTPAVQALPASVRDRWLAAIPIKRPSTPEEVADLIAFLAAEGTASINGQDIGIDGGLNLPILTLGTDRDESRS